jgi:signal recognition particle receptor subunit beta
MISMATETDRTLFFDFMPMELGTIGGQKIRVQLYTVPGQVFYDATRKLVLRGADGVVFVADSQPSMKESNLESLENLRTNLRLNRIDPDKVGIVFQYNKRDLPGVASIEEMNEYMQPGNIPVVEASAIKGVGVTQTLRAAIARILDNLKNNVDTTLYDAAPLQRPVMTAMSGATSGSAGVPKVSIAALTAEKSASRPATQSRPMPVAAPAPPPPRPAPAAPAAPPPKAKTFDFTEIDDEANDADPFAAPPPAAAIPEEPQPFAIGEDLDAVDDAPFDVSAAAIEEEPTVFEPEINVLAEPQMPEESPVEEIFSAGAIDEVINSADAMIRMLESALEHARRHRDHLRALHGR